MYQKHFGLTERPFSIAPDPRFLYMSQQHREALAHLLYGVGEGGGFVQLTGEVGTGKTTICRCLLEQTPDHVDVALILNPRVTALELLASLCDELCIPYARDTTSIKSLTDVLNAYLLDSHSRGRRTVLMIDEAQNLSAEALEQVRLLTNLETTREKLLQIILVGQPELRNLLAREELRQLAQRITARYHLQPIGRAETAAYIRHRLQVCGSNDPVFSDPAIDLIQTYSAGVPRLINVLCDRAMLGAFVEGRRQVDAAIVRKAAREVLPEEGLDAPAGRRWLGGAAVAATLLAAVAAYWFLADTRRPFERALHEPLPAVASQTPAAVAEPAPEPLAAAVATDAEAIEEVPERIEAPPPVPPDEAAAAEVAAVSAVSGEVVEETTAVDLRRVLAASGPDAVTRAWAALYKLWGIRADVASDEQACAQAPGVGLRCLQGGGSWAALTHYDRPALLRLVAEEGRRIPVLLQELMGAQARIVVDGDAMVVPLNQVKQRWFGEYRLLWRTPPDGHAVLRPGDRGGDVAWLRERLQKATGMASITADPAYYDPALKALVESFQRDQALSADGVAGPRTLINLNNLERQPSVPRLGATHG